MEPFAFTPNMIDIWAYDVDKQDSRVYKVMRIHSVEVLDTPWAHADKHEVRKPDVFRMSGKLNEKIVLELDTRAKSLLLEEYPMAEKDLKREDGKWILRTTIHSPASWSSTNSSSAGASTGARLRRGGNTGRE